MENGNEMIKKKWKELEIHKDMIYNIHSTHIYEGGGIMWIKYNDETIKEPQFLWCKKGSDPYITVTTKLLQPQQANQLLNDYDPNQHILMYLCVGALGQLVRVNAS